MLAEARDGGRAGGWRGWLAGAALCTVVSAIVATQNHQILASRAAPGEVVTWMRLFLRELPVWFSWLVLAPAIFAVARRVAANHRPPGQVALVQLPLGVLFTIAHLTLVPFSRRLLFAADYAGAPPMASIWMRGLQAYLFTFLIIYAAIVGGYYALAYYRAYRQRELRASQLEALLAQAQLDTLRMQLHPHFLFNTLHSISALMARDVPTARRMIARLGDLLRLSLDDDGAQEVALIQEVDFLRQYVELQQMRFGSRLAVSIELAPDTLDILVPRLALQPLVENAIRHGAARRGQATVEVRSRLEGGRLRVTVADDGPGLPPGGESAIREGVGLRNTRARLAQLHGSAQRFSIANRPEGGACVTMVVPARRAALAALARDERELHGHHDATSLYTTGELPAVGASAGRDR